MKKVLLIAILLISSSVIFASDSETNLDRLLKTSRVQCQESSLEACQSANNAVLIEMFNLKDQKNKRIESLLKIAKEQCQDLQSVGGCQDANNAVLREMYSL